MFWLDALPALWLSTSSCRSFEPLLVFERSRNDETNSFYKIRHTDTRVTVQELLQRGTDPNKLLNKANRTAKVALPRLTPPQWMSLIKQLTDLHFEVIVCSAHAVKALRDLSPCLSERQLRSVHVEEAEY